MQLGIADKREKAHKKGYESEYIKIKYYKKLGGPSRENESDMV